MKNLIIYPIIIGSALGLLSGCCKKRDTPNVEDGAAGKISLVARRMGTSTSVYSVEYLGRNYLIARGGGGGVDIIEIPNDPDRQSKPD